MSNERSQLVPKPTISLWRRVKGQLDAGAVNFNCYDLIAPLWQASAIFGCMIYGTWLHDNCPLEVEHHSNLSYTQTQNTAISLAVASYVLALSCRVIEKRFKLQPMQQYINYLKGEDITAGDYKSLSTSHPLHRFVIFDEILYRLSSAMLGWAASLSFYAICTIQDTKQNAHWDGCWQLDALKIITCIGAMLAGLATESPLTQKRREFEIEIEARTPAGTALN